MELCKEGLEQKRFDVKYVHTSKMIADGLSKPLEGKSFLTFANTLLGIVAE